MLAALLLSATLTTIPQTPLIETTKSGQALNFDLVVENTSDAKLAIEQIEATVLDANGAMVTQRRLQGNGASILTLPQRAIEPHRKLVIFNPFPTFESDLALHAIRYDISFEDGSHESITIAPKKYEQKANLMLPATGRVFASPCTSICPA